MAGDETQTQSSRLELPVEEALRYDLYTEPAWLRERVDWAVLHGHHLIFDLRWLDDQRYVEKYKIEYHTLDPTILPILNRVIRDVFMIEFPATEGQQYAMPPILYVGAPLLVKPDPKHVGLLVTMKGLALDPIERTRAAEVEYACPVCGAREVRPTEQPIPRCSGPKCGKVKMEKVDIIRFVTEIHFMLRYGKNDFIRCVAPKEILWNEQKSFWYVAWGSENEVTGVLRVREKKDGTIEYYLDVTGAVMLVPYPRRSGEQEVAPVWPPELGGWPTGLTQQHGTAVRDMEIRTLEDVRRCFPRIVGEDSAIYTLVLALASRWNLDKNQWIMGAIIRGQSSAGKSYLAKNVIEPWRLLGRVKDLTRFTGAYLERLAQILQTENIDNLIFLVYELFSQTPQQLHIMLSEGKLVLGVVDKNTGEPVEYEIEGRPFLLATTTSVEIREDLENRVLTVKIDESENHTKRLVEFYSRMRSDPEFRYVIESEAEKGARALAEHLASLRTMPVIIPYAHLLGESFRVVHDVPISLRRDYQKMLALIEASALLFQHHRPRVRKPLNGAEMEFVVATEEDFMNLLKCLPQLGVTLHRISDPERAILEILEPVSGPNAIGRDKPGLTVREIAVELGQRGYLYSSRWVREMLEKLANLGYVVVRDEYRPHRYELAKKPADYRFDIVEEIARVVREYLASHGVHWDASRND